MSVDQISSCVVHRGLVCQDVGACERRKDCQGGCVLGRRATRQSPEDSGGLLSRQRWQGADVDTRMEAAQYRDCLSTLHLDSQGTTPHWHPLVELPQALIPDASALLVGIGHVYFQFAVAQHALDDGTVGLYRSAIDGEDDERLGAPGQRGVSGPERARAYRG